MSATRRFIGLAFAMSLAPLPSAAHAQDVVGARAALAGSASRLDADTPEANSTVHLVRPGSMCSATLVAPRLVLTAAHCMPHDPPSASTPRDAVGNWETPGQWYPLYSFPTGGVRITVGPSRSRPRFTATVFRYSVAGYADVMLLALREAVPSDIATPAPVLMDMPGPYDPTRFLRDKRYEMVGWGGIDDANTIPDGRRIAGASFAEYPNDTFFSDSLRVTMRGDGGTEIRGGDSGGSLYWRDPATRRRYLVAVTQGTERGGGRFFLTFARGGSDDRGNRRPNVSAWLKGHLTERVVWERVGHPSAARQIAACQDGLLYALNGDASLWRNRDHGADGRWQRLGTLSGATNLVCAQNRLYYQNGRRELFRVDPNRAGALAPERVGRPWGAARLAGTEVASLDFPLLWALNDDKTLWRNGNLGADGNWTRVGQPGLADRIAATQSEVWALNSDKTLWRNTSGGRDGQWQRLDRPHAALEIAAAAPRAGGETTLWVLNTDYTLWRGRIELGNAPRP